MNVGICCEVGIVNGSDKFVEGTLERLRDEVGVDLVVVFKREESGGRGSDLND